MTSTRFTKRCGSLPQCLSASIGLDFDFPTRAPLNAFHALSFTFRDLLGQFNHNYKFHLPSIATTRIFASMSDHEDEMDVDAPSKDIQFSSENVSGKKRTVADLPIQAQDNLPWCEIPHITEQNDIILIILLQTGSRNIVRVR